MSKNKPLIRRVVTALSISTLALALTGCVVVPLPWGGGGHGGGRDHGDGRYDGGRGYGHDPAPRR